MRRLDIDEAIRNLLATNAAYAAYLVLNGREPSDAELVEFRPKYEAAAKSGLFDLDAGDDE